MALFSSPNVSIAGISCAVPLNVEDNIEAVVLPENERELFVKTVGIRYRRVAKLGVTASDLCFESAAKLLQELNWKREDISVLIFVTQTPDYLIPNTSSILQERLELGKNCICFDVNLGCSGYVYGLSIASSLLGNMKGGKALLLVGDVSTAVISKDDKSVVPLFSDAGSATALEYKQSENFFFHLQTDGKEYEDIIIRDGGLRNPFTTDSLETKSVHKGIARNRMQMELDGIKIFNFALREVVPNIELLLQHFELKKEAIEYFVFHQANLLMLESIRKKLSVLPEKVPYSLYDFGNTSSASIPMTIVTQLQKELTSGEKVLLLSGFGVGLSWGTIYLRTHNICCPNLIELA